MWPETISDEQWSVYQRVIADARAALPFAIGGGIAVGVYADHWRESKDIDFYVLRKDREILQNILTAAGLVDYYDQLPYDREWIYRSIKDKIIVDVIWAMANYKNEVDESWIMDGPEVTMRGETFRLVPAEEMIWAKLYVVQRDRTDWPDALNILYAQRENLNWRRLMDRLDDDAPLLYGLLTVFRWLCPNLAADLPPWLWAEFEKSTSMPPVAADVCRYRADLLDRRCWFKPVMTT